MSVTDLIARITPLIENGGEFDWRRLQKEIVAEHRNATTTAERVLCLGLHKAVLDAVERNSIEPTEMTKFQTLRQQEYNLLLINEAMIGKTDGLIDPIVMKAITDREVAAGRMLENDGLRNLVASYVAVTVPEDMLKKSDMPKKSGGMLAGIKSWFR